jgi:hypothetical protein
LPESKLTAVCFPAKFQGIRFSAALFAPPAVLAGLPKKPEPTSFDGR